MPQRIFKRKIFQKKNLSEAKRIFFLVLKYLPLALLIAIVSVIFLFFYYAKDLPRPEKFTERDFVESTKIFDRTGKVLLYEYGNEKREIVSLDSISPLIQHAVISAEDAKFYQHHGIDMGAIFRSILTDIRIGKPTYGASTISQQLIRSTFLSQEKTVKRKIREIILTIELERRYSKTQILEWYLNQIPFGPNTYGVESASQTYFNKLSKDVSLEEAATLAAIIKNPVAYLVNKEALRTRRDYVLDRMNEEGFISKDEANAAKEKPLTFIEADKGIKAPHFTLYVRNYLLNNYGEDVLNKGGLRVYTTLDWEIEQAAETAISDGLKKFTGRTAPHNAALVSIDPKTGEILAMVGSANWFADPYPEGCTPGKNCMLDPKVNVSTALPGRQPGSAFKPFAYVTAFSKGYNDSTMVVDEPTNFGDYAGKPYMPQNYDGLYRGPVTLRQALAQSLNVPSVKVLAYLAGQRDTIATAKKLGITTLIQPDSFYGLSIVLGGGEVRLIDMVSAYGVFATDGMQISPVSILKVEDSRGNVLEENHKTPKRVLDSKDTRIINSILSDNAARTPVFGANSIMHFANYQVAVKTGTTSDYKDGWIIGYTPSLVAGVWVGNSDNTPMQRDPAVILSGPAWRAFMDKALPKMPKEYFTPPEPSIPIMGDPTQPATPDNSQ